MTLSVGDTLPDVNLLRMGADGPESVGLSSLLAGRNVVIFAVPSAFSAPARQLMCPAISAPSPRWIRPGWTM